LNVTKTVPALLLTLMWLLFPGRAWLSGYTGALDVQINTTSSNLNETLFFINITTADVGPTWDWSEACAGEINVTDTDDTPLPYSVNSSLWYSLTCNNQYMELEFEGRANNTNMTQARIYYGHPSGSSASSEESIYRLYDTFPGSSLDAAKWDDSGATVTGGYVELDPVGDYIIATETYNSSSAGTLTKIQWSQTDTSKKFYVGVVNSRATQYSDLGGATDLRGINIIGWTDNAKYFQNRGTGVKQESATGASQDLTTRTDMFYYLPYNPAIIIYDADSGTNDTDTTAANVPVISDGIRPSVRAHSSDGTTMRVYTLTMQGWTDAPISTGISGYTETANDSLTFAWDPASPHVEENVTFNITTAGSYSMSDFWWNFSDGTGIHYTDNDKIGHVFYLGESYNVSLIGLNASGTNYSYYDTVTVTEPTIQVWLRDSVSGNMLNSFSVSVWNNTNQSNFTTTGYYVEWDYHEGPRGNVTLEGIKAYYNVTGGSANITNSSDVNVTLTADPAVVIIRPRDASFPQLPVPVEIRMDNLTATRTQDSDLDEDLIDESVTCPSNPCTNTSTSSDYYGQVFEYTLTAVGTGTGVGDIIRAFLYIKDEDGDTQLIDWANKSGGSGTESVSRILYLSEAGYEIRDAAGTLIRSSTNILDAYPFRAYVDLHASTDGAGETSSAAGEVDGATSEFAFYIPDGATLGITNIVVAQKTGSPFGYVDTTYYYQKLAFPIYETSRLNYTVYLYRSADAVLQDIYVIDYNNDPITDAYVQAFGTINASELISSSYTDGSGKVELPLKASQQFNIIASATGYDAESVTLYPSTSALYITLTQATTEWTGPFSGISYDLDVGEPIIQGHDYNITYTLADSYAGLSNFSLKVWGNTTLVNSDSSSSATGGILYYEFTAPDYGYYVVNTEFYRTYNSTLYHYEANVTYSVLTSGTFDDLKEEISKLDAQGQAMLSLLMVGAGFVINPAAGAVMGVVAYLIGLIGEGLFVLMVLAFAFVYGRRLLQ